MFTKMISVFLDLAESLTLSIYSFLEQYFYVFLIVDVQVALLVKDNDPVYSKMTSAGRAMRKYLNLHYLSTTYSKTYHHLLKATKKEEIELLETEILPVGNVSGVIESILVLIFGYCANVNNVDLRVSC